MKFRIFLLLFVAPLILTACGGGASKNEEPAATEFPPTYCPLHVEVVSTINQGDNEIVVELLATKDFVVKSEYYSEEEYGTTYTGFHWKFNDDSQLTSDSWFKEVVLGSVKDMNRRLADAFVMDGVYTFSYLAPDSDWADLGSTKEAVCPVGDFKKTITLKIGNPYGVDENESRLMQTDTNNGLVEFTYTRGVTETEKGSVMHISMPFDQFRKILDGTAIRFDNLATPVQMDYTTYSQTLTDLEFTQGKREVASFTMLPEDSKAHADIFGLIKRITQFTDAVTPYVFMNTLTNDTQGARLIGTVIEGELSKK